VQSYLAAVMPALAARGHAVALLHLDALRGGEGTPAPAGAPHFCVEAAGVDAALFAALQWAPDVVFSHNMRALELERRLLAAAPVVKMMHGYFGTCIGGQKAHLFPRAEPCGRKFGPACLALYLPRRNGRLSVPYVAEQWRWANEANALFGHYAAVVTASGHMRREYVRNGVPAELAHAIPLFSTLRDGPPPPQNFLGEGENGDGLDGSPGTLRVAFLGRMTRLKGGDVLVRAVAGAARRVGHSIPLVMMGEGPQRAEWEALARSLGVDAAFPGWVDAAERTRLLCASSLLAVPSVWPEPFGLVGLEAGSLGVPAVAFDVGGISEWLHDGENGWLVPGGPPRASALADALVRAHERPDELAAMRAGARAVAARMSLDAHVARLEAVLGGARTPGLSS
jgi:glycosyltransferase involved in cell wall biosynthesis